MLYRNRKHRACQNETRRGVAVTEFAVCMPVLVLILLGTIESSAMVFLQQSLSVAAYEGARIALVPNAKAGNVESQCDLILKDRGVKNSSVTVKPAAVHRAPEGTWISVTTSAPFKENSLVGGWLFAGRTLTATVEMMKER